MNAINFEATEEKIDTCSICSSSLSLIILYFENEIIVIYNNRVKRRFVEAVLMLKFIYIFFPMQIDDESAKIIEH